MREFLVFLTACGAVLVCGVTPALSAPHIGPGWFGLFPSLPNYSFSYQAPVVAAGSDPAAYRQEVRYDWMGNDLRQATATLARDPNFTTQYAAEALQKAGAVKVAIGKRTGWLRRQGLGAGVEGPQLIVPLAADRALLVTGVAHFGEEEVLELAGLFDLDRAEEALARPPQTDWTRNRALFRSLPRAASFLDVFEWAGNPDRTTLREKQVEGMDYRLTDGSSVHLTFDGGRLKDMTFRDPGRPAGAP